MLKPSTLAQHWNNIGWLSRVCWDYRIAMRVTLSYPGAKKATSQITRYRMAQCRCNVGPPSATLGQHDPNQNPLSSNHKYNREYYFLLTLFKNATVWHIRHADKDWCTEMSTVSHTQQPSFPKIGHKLREINLIGSWDEIKIKYRWKLLNYTTCLTLFCVSE